MIRSYPLKIEKLEPKDLKALTYILNIDITSTDEKDKPGPDVERRVRNLITQLPPQLRDHWIFRLIPNSVIPCAVACPVHEDLNRPVINHVFRLIKREVGLHLDVLYEFPDLVGEEEKTILGKLRAMEGMWMDVAPPGSWDFQHNKCEACMLARIGADQAALENLRIVLLSRNRTRKPRPPPRLIKWVEEWIGQHIDACRLFYASGMKAYAMKEMRKAALRARRKQRLQQEHHEIREKVRKKHERDEKSVHENSMAGGSLTDRIHEMPDQSKQPEHQPSQSNGSRLQVSQVGGKNALQRIYKPGQSYIDIHSIVNLYRPSKESLRGAWASVERLVAKIHSPKPEQAPGKAPFSTPNPNAQSPMLAYRHPRDCTDWDKLFEDLRAGRPVMHGKAKELEKEYLELLPKYEYSDSEYRGEEREDCPVYEEKDPAAQTTWSLLLKEK